MTDHLSATGGLLSLDRSPLLPRGATVFTDLPVSAVVLDALGPVIDAGVLRVRAPHASAVLLIRDGAIAESHLLTATEHHSGDWVLTRAQGWDDGVVSAERYDSGQLSLCATLLHGQILYDDLRLEWTDWAGLLADLTDRGSAYAIELSTPSGRAVACLVAGRRTHVYVDAYPALGDPPLLETMAQSGSGFVRVRLLATPAPRLRRPVSNHDTAVDQASVDPYDQGGSVPGAPLPQGPPDPVPPPPPSPRISSLPEWSAAPALSPEESASSRRSPEVSPSTARSPEVAAPSAASPEGPTPSALGADVDERVRQSGIGVLFPDISWAAPWQVSWRGDASDEDHLSPTGGGNGRGIGGNRVGNGTDAGGDETDPPQPNPKADHPHLDTASPTLSTLQDGLHAIAGRHLHLSASRVDSALQAAAAQSLPLDETLHDLRALSIRGVMPATINAMVDEMAALAESSRAG